MSDSSEDEFHQPTLWNGGNDSGDSDKELKIAYEAGLLKPGLLKTDVKRPDPVNNVKGILEKLEEIYQKELNWVERLDITVERKERNDPTLDASLLENERKNSFTTSVHNDFKRELSFLTQAQDAVLEALPKLKNANIYTKRPEDYFAEMAKKDDHMKKIRENLLSVQKRREKNEKFRNQMRLKKYGKKIQKAVELERSKQKKDTLDSIKKYRQGKQNADFLENKNMKKGSNIQNNQRTKQQSRQKREVRDKKYGFGGKKRRMKSNTSTSVNDVSSYKSGKKPKKNFRPGKSRRKVMKSKS